MKHMRLFIILAIVIVSPAAVYFDIAADFSAGFEPRPLFHYAKLLAKAGWLLVLAAAAYYFLRTWLVMMKKRSFTHKGLLMIQHLSRILRHVHPFAGAAAFTLIALHGFVFAYRILDFEMNTATVTGILAFAVFFFTAIIGIVLYVKPGQKTVRKIHRYAAFIVLVLAVAHLLFPD